ncbi:MAG: hypothetical protein CMQ60_03920 [Gammaproteobacteria bacterium]|nr:hypothetical protein [Gammaproteobacteria bacterium]
MLEEFKDNKHLVRMSPFLVATAMGKADGIFLEEEKVVELSHFEEFSLHADEFTANAELFLNLENDDFHHIWEMEINEILEALKELPTAARIVLGLDAEHLVEMLERVVLQVARSDGDVHDLEIATAGELEVIFDSIRDDSSVLNETNFDNSPYDISDIESKEIIDSIDEYNQENSSED